MPSVTLLACPVCKRETPETGTTRDGKLFTYTAAHRTITTLGHLYTHSPKLPKTEAGYPCPVPGCDHLEQAINGETANNQLTLHFKRAHEDARPAAPILASAAQIAADQHKHVGSCPIPDCKSKAKLKTRQMVTRHIVANHAPRRLKKTTFSICACEPGHCSFIVTLEEAGTDENIGKIMVRHMQDAHPGIPPFVRVPTPNRPDRVVRTAVGEAQTSERLDEALYLTLAEICREVVAEPGQSELDRRIARCFATYFATEAVATRERLSLWYKYEK